LGAYVDGELSPARARAVALHLRHCQACAALYERLRNVDGLLFSASGTPLGPDFVTGVMSRVKAMPAHAHQRRSQLLSTLLHLTLAWVGGLLLVLLFWQTAARAGVAALHEASLLAQALAGGTHAFWPLVPLATSAGIALLSIDLMLLAATMLFYRSLRPRLAVHLANGRRLPS
jgi:anti-sigma factor RsiW